jgi:hypothetical protein
MDRKHIGAQNELIATVWLLQEGYEVFRNVSPHGPVDLIGLKNGEVHKFDVKGWRTIRLTAEQIALGVKILRVSSSGECDVFDNPLPPFEGRFEGTCKRCREPMISRTPKQIFCSDGCRTRHYLERAPSEASPVADSGLSVR